MNNHIFGGIGGPGSAGDRGGDGAAGGQAASPDGEDGALCPGGGDGSGGAVVDNPTCSGSHTRGGAGGSTSCVGANDGEPLPSTGGHGGESGVIGVLSKWEDFPDCYFNCTEWGGELTGKDGGAGSDGSNGGAGAGCDDAGGTVTDHHWRGHGRG